MTITYGSVCSGIEAASVAWQPLGWKPVWFSEIEPHPSAVLAHHWPDVPNEGDMLNLPDLIEFGLIEAPDVIVGGTPCQSFSIAGRRGSLSDERGALSLAYVELANRADEKRKADGKPPTVIVWENVPGVLSTSDNAFGCFIAGLAGDSEPLEPGPRPEPGRSSQNWRWKKDTGEHRAKWPLAGCVLGPQRAVAWRVLDAQHFGVAQRRRRVFVIASARAGFDPAEVLFEFGSLRRDSPPSREKGKVAPTLPARRTAGGGLGTDFDCDGGLVVTNPEGQTAFGGNRCTGPIDVATALSAHPGSTGRLDFASETFIVTNPEGATGLPFLTRSNLGKGVNNQTPLIFEPRFVRNGRGAPEEEICPPLEAQSGQTGEGDAAPCVAFKPSHYTRGKDGAPSEIHPPLSADADKGDQDPVVAFSSKDYGADAQVEVTPTMRAMNHHGSHANAGGQLAVAQRATSWRVRRLMPVEASRLQGFADHYFDGVQYKGKPLADGPMYRMLGNSMATTVVHWLGRRINKALS